MSTILQRPGTRCWFWLPNHRFLVIRHRPMYCLCPKAPFLIFYRMGLRLLFFGSIPWWKPEILFAINWVGAGKMRFAIRWFASECGCSVLGDSILYCKGEMHLPDFRKLFSPFFFFIFSFAILPILSVVLCVFITHFLWLFVIFTSYQIKSPFDIVYFVHLYWLFLSFSTFSGAMAGIFTNLYAFVFIFYTSLQFYQSVFFL